MFPDLSRTRFLRLLQTTAPAILLMLFFGVLIRTAFVCDDSFITFRTVDNFVNGYGLRWNVDERVQAYTNTLWMFVISGMYSLTREIYYTSLTACISFAVASVYLVSFGISRSALSALLASTILLLSKAFVDFSTSGLENPLTHFLIALFFVVYIGQGARKTRHPFLLALVAALAMLNRPECLLLLMPSLVIPLWRSRSWRMAGVMLAGFTPLLAWESFSLVYYGFLFPNPAYAKLFTTGIGIRELVPQGLIYLGDSFSRDPITLCAIGASFLSVIVTRQWNLLPLSIGVLLSIVYVVRIGGDFMTGRFLSAPLFLATIVLSRVSWPWDGHRAARTTVLASVFGLFLVVGFSVPTPTLLSGRDFSTSPASPRGIADVRGRQYQMTGLLRVLERGSLGSVPVQGIALREGDQEVVAGGGVGYLGYYAGPRVHVTDYFGLTDAFLARLPSSRPWAIAHFRRAFPAGYLDSLWTGENLIEPESLAYLYDQVKLVTRGDLLDRNRWRAIWFLNSGGYRKLLVCTRSPAAADLRRSAITNRCPSLDSVIGPT